MWFLGLVLGLILGGLSSGAWGAAFGAFFGAIAGWGLGKLLGIGGASAASAEMIANTAAINAHLTRLQKAVEDIHWRLARIESREKNVEAGDTVTPAVTPVVAPVVIPLAAALTSDAAVLTTSTAAPATAWGREAGVQVSDVSLSNIDNERDALVTATNESAARIKATAEILAAANASVPPTRDELIKPNLLWAWLTGGNTIVRVGVLILFIGMAFLVKYAAENAMFPLELRLAAVGAGAIALLVIGWRLRLQPTRAGYALTLQGAGVAILDRKSVV